MEKKYTPGPWSVDVRVFERSTETTLKGHVAIDAPEHGAIAQVVYRMDDGSIVPFYANLIAAAPDLLEALEAQKAADHARAITSIDMTQRGKQDDAYFEFVTEWKRLDDIAKKLQAAAIAKAYREGV